VIVADVLSALAAFARRRWKQVRAGVCSRSHARAVFARKNFRRVVVSLTTKFVAEE